MTRLIVGCVAMAWAAVICAAEPEGGLRFDFESGDLQGWRVVAGEFESLLTERSHFHHANDRGAYNKQGRYFLSTLERAGENAPPNDGQIGIVESPVFKLQGESISLLVGGGAHAETYAALCDAADGKELRQARGQNAEPMQRVTWDVKDLKDRLVVLRLVDRHQGGWGHITLDEVVTDGAIDTAATERRKAQLAAQPSPLVAAVAPAPGLVIESEQGVKHALLATGSETYMLSDTGEVTWRYPLPSRDGYVLASGNVLLAVGKCGPYPGGAVVEVTPDGKVVFEYKGTQAEVNSAQLTDDDHIVLTEAGPNPRLLELDREGKVVVEFPLECQKPDHHMQTRMTRKLANGNYLAPHLLDFAVKEYDPTGKVVNTLATDDRGREKRDWPFTAIRLAGGHTVIGCTNGNRVIELDAEGKIVWQVTNDDLPGDPLDDPCGVQRLPNGNTVITSYHGRDIKMLEVTPEKQIVWQLRSPGPGIHHFQILDTNGKKLEGQPLK